MLYEVITGLAAYDANHKNSSISSILVQVLFKSDVFGVWNEIETQSELTQTDRCPPANPVITSYSIHYTKLYEFA